MVYLIHFDKPYKHAKHYIGFTDSESPEQRLARHRSGKGANLLRVLNLAGIGYDIVHTWPEGDQAFERNLKNQSRIRLRKYCAICQQQEGVNHERSQL